MKLFFNFKVLLIGILISGNFILIRADEPKPKYHSPSEIARTIRSFQSKFPQISRFSSIGQTVTQKDIFMLEISNQKKGKPEEKGALCIVANIDGNHLIGTEIAMNTAQFLLENYGKIDSITNLIDEKTVYIIPCVNVDGAQQKFKMPLYEVTTNLFPVDDDFDAATDEDGPDDLNNDGIISMMRIPDMQGAWLQDSSDARLMRLANALKGEQGTHRLETEGIDNDGDEKVNEDPPGGVKLNQNFPQAYPHYKPNSGRYILSEPESKALVDFFLVHRNIVLVLELGSFDNLSQPPEMPKAGTSTAEKNESAANQSRKKTDYNKIADDDWFIYQKLSALYNQIIKPKPAPQIEKPYGAFHQWVYFQYGVPALCIRAWSAPEEASTEKTEVEPDSIKKTEKDASYLPEKTAPEKDEKTKKLKKPEKSDDLKWLEWSDRQLNGQGFVNWQPFTHPTLGQVEIGGFVPYVKTNPPAEQISAVAAMHSRFILALPDLFPRVVLRKIDVQSKANAVFQLTVEIEKKGFLPDATAFARQNRIAKPSIIKINPGPAKILAGRSLVRLSSLRLDGDYEKVEWQLLGKKGQKITLEILTEKAGKITREIELD